MHSPITRHLLIVLLLLGLLAVPAVAQQEKQPAPKSQPPTVEDFTKLLGEWKKDIARLREIEKEFQTATPEKQGTLRTEYILLTRKLKAKEKELMAAAEVAYQADPKKFATAGDLLAMRADQEVVDGDYKEATRLLALLEKQGFEDPALHNLAAIAAVGTEDYKSAEQHLNQAKKDEALVPITTAYLREIETRKKEAASDNLPQVSLKTNKGEIVLELFEDQAPNTVANFISLVEKDFYDGKTFHRVIEDFVAQGGCPKGDGTGGPGYAIACEIDEKSYRPHFRGSISMAHAGKDTGGSQFFLCFRPLPFLDKKHTVFGRVIKGFEAMDSIQKTTEKGTEPDKIVDAKVLRKRDHEYKPETLPDPRKDSEEDPNKQKEKTKQ